MKEVFEVASGSITGRDHRLAGRNNQDACYWLSTERATVAVVCDGCSSGKHSEVGAKIGARLIVEAILRHFKKLPQDSIPLLENGSCLFWERVRQDVSAQIRILAIAMGNSFSQTVNDYFLFTVLGALVTPTLTFIFSIGDGLYWINEEMNSIGPFESNEPPYLAYDLIETTFNQSKPELLKFQIHEHLLTSEIKSLVIGTDGIFDLNSAAERKMPGKEEKVCPINQFWQEDGYFENSDKIRRKLTLVNRDVKSVDWDEKSVLPENGLLRDDTTLVVIRRRKVKRDPESNSG